MSQARLLKPDSSGIQQATLILRQHGVVGMPTETVYGLAGLAWDEIALAKIFSAKERPTFDPLILHVSPGLLGKDPWQGLLKEGLVDDTQLDGSIRKTAQKLIEKFWPGPLTLVLPKTLRVPDLATSGLPSVALRMPSHPIALALIDAVGAPLAAPSANRFGRISPTQASHVMDELSDRIDAVIDGDPSQVGVESTILRLLPGQPPQILRPGGVPAQALESALGISFSVNAPKSEAASEPHLKGLAAPGMLASHYAPRKKLVLMDSLHPRTPETFRQTAEKALGKNVQAKIALLLWMPGLPVDAGSTGLRIVKAMHLSPDGQDSIAARNLFACLRELDQSDADLILAERCPDPSLGLQYAIQDRLNRASHPHE